MKLTMYGVLTAYNFCHKMINGDVKFPFSLLFAICLNVGLTQLS